MSKQLSTSEFFNLTNFEHAALFDESSFVWEALKNLWTYLNTFNYEDFDPQKYPGVFFENSKQIHIGENVNIEPGSYIRGPTILGSNTQVRHGAYIRGCVVTGNNCVIGHASEITRSILLNQAKCPHFNYVGDSILGNDVNLGAGFITANLKHNESEVYVTIGIRKISTGLKKMGAIFGDGTKVGCNSVSNPGTIFTKNSVCLPCKSIRGVVE